MPNRARRRQQDAKRPGGRLDVDRIVHAAITLADREGLEAVSIRRVAGALDARPMSLYTYVATKDELLRRIGEEVVAETVVRDSLPSAWRAALTVIALRAHRTFLAHPWLLELTGRRPDLGVSAVQHAEQLLSAVAPLRLSARDAWQVLYAVNDYTLGHAMRLGDVRRAREPYPRFAPAEYPHLDAAIKSGIPERDEETFLAGLELLLDGVEHRYSRGR